MNVEEVIEVTRFELFERYFEHIKFKHRISEKVKISCVSATIKALKALNLDFCLRIKEEIDKEEIKTLDTSVLTKIGVKVEKEDKLSIEPNFVEILAKEG